MRIVIMFILIGVFSLHAFTQKAGYVCPPCGCSNDGKVFKEPGKCPACSMILLNKDNKSEGLNYANLDPEEVCELQSRVTNVLFLDVRTEGEFNRSPLGRIKDAKHIHVEELGSRIKELAEYKNKEIIVYCLVGIRSARASEYLAENGFTKVNNMLGGMELWNQSRDETVKCKNTLLDR
jgi:rhodanese-related sulfurtransferase